MIYTLYADLVFLLNFFFDFLLLLGVAKFSGCHFHIVRLVLASIVGAFYGILVFLPNFLFISNGFIVFLFPLILLFICFGKMDIHKLIRLFLYYYLLSFAMNGIATAGISIFRSLGFDEEIFPVLFLPILLVAFFAKIGFDVFQKFIAKERCFSSGIISLGSEKIKIKVFFDTGNNLKDPVSGNPVMVVEYNIVKKFLPEELCYEYEKFNASEENMVHFFDMVGKKYSSTDWFNRLSLLSFRSVGKKQGFLLGVRPDNFAVGSQKADIILALYNGKLGKNRDFQAIVSPWIFSSKKMNNEKKGDVCV